MDCNSGVQLNWVRTESYIVIDSVTECEPTKKKTDGEVPDVILNLKWALH